MAPTLQPGNEASGLGSNRGSRDLQGSPGSCVARRGRVSACQWPTGTLATSWSRAWPWLASGVALEKVGVVGPSTSWALKFTVADSALSGCCAYPGPGKAAEAALL